MTDDIEESFLRVTDLRKEFVQNDGVIDRLLGSTREVKAVRDVSFDIQQGETLGLVGESGSGKSTTARSLLRLIEPTAGTVTFDGTDITSLSERELKRFRKRMQIVFQDPASSLNRRKTVDQIIRQPMKIHGLYAGERTQQVRDLMEQVGLPPGYSNRYPHEFSGGQRQRIGIARALAVEPDFLVCDEPVSALDVSIQAQILNLLTDLQDEYDLTILFIAHDLSVIRHVCDRVAVMYLGEIVEVSDTESLFRSPQHPYTKSLIRAIPEPDPTLAREREALSGEVPSPIDPPSGCSFHPRCPMATPECQSRDPSLEQVSGAKTSHEVSCIHVDKFEEGSDTRVDDRSVDRYAPEAFDHESEATPIYEEEQR
ncbi:peptide ABC transporter ATP-binding protein [Haladaptatus sp. R4]|uniref:ABC transporter ATP-binding protein n=1 Tax=Haladaptatus sp. R4 TaxID=1679489 RepID=UPI0007B4A63C|nr:ABC transporter ATP-binding protein [Haladaptatus sp. R4]KZN23167.1 peptide ABC transporter ATP-binding protein [Haladaptatus sp. R4]